MSGLCSLLELVQFVMWGAAPPRHLRRQNRATWLLVFLPLLSLNNTATMSQDGHELMHVISEDSRSSLIIVGAGGGEHEQQQQLSRLGFRPPFCERKCGGCAPCTAVQVRAGAAEGPPVRPQCANYEPVGWKCKCGAAVFDP